MKLKFFFVVTVLIAFCCINDNLSAVYTHPYGINNWSWYANSTCQWFKDAHINYYRFMLDWSRVEPSNNTYDFSAGGNSDVDSFIDAASASGAKASLCLHGVPAWALQNPNNYMSAKTTDYADFITTVLQHCESRAPGVVTAFELFNEEPTQANWQTNARDASLYYADFIKVGYQAVKAVNPNILVVTGAIWQGANHSLDDIYQLGCKGYFDRVSLHYYLMDVSFMQNHMSDIGMWNYNTTLRYLNSISREYGDNNMLIWVTEHGTRPYSPDGLREMKWPMPIGETWKAQELEYFLNQSRKSGIVDNTAMYVGTTYGYPNNHDTIALIYCDQDWVPNPSLLVKTTSYYVYQRLGNQYPVWDPALKEPLDTVPPGPRVYMDNPGFEAGTSAGWANATVDSTQKHSGNYSGKSSIPGIVHTMYYPSQELTGYDVTAWVKVTSNDKENTILTPTVTMLSSTGTETWMIPPNYYGVGDTSKYPGGWRKLKFFHVMPANQQQIRLLFSANGTGNFWVDDVVIRPLDFSTGPLVNVYPKILNFGEVPPGEASSLSFSISNIAEGTLSGSITTAKSWIKITPATFSGNNITATVVVDNGILSQSGGNPSGDIIVATNGGTITMQAQFAATCVLTKPNPYYPASGKPLVFFGDGVVPEKTRIKIYTLGNDLIADLIAPKDGNEVNWDGKNKAGAIVPSGVYVYTYESPKEKGVNKFTVIK